MPVLVVGSGGLVFRNAEVTSTATTATATSAMPEITTGRLLRRGSSSISSGCRSSPMYAVRGFGSCWLYGSSS